jgi:RNA polymerase sigma-70 factor, ECF subfamily
MDNARGAGGVTPALALFSRSQPTRPARYPDNPNMETKAPPDSIERLRSGDPEAFDAVYSAEKVGLYGFLLRLARDPHVAADLFQNVWLKLAKHATSLRPESNVRAWLHTVARREYLSFRRAQALDLSRLLVLGLETASSPPDAHLDMGLDSLRTALDRLVDADREVLLLTQVDGIDSAQAAEILGISTVALRQRVVRARRRLSQLLAETGDGQQARFLRGAR